MRGQNGISAVFADMDGTFLAADKSIPSRNLRVLDTLHHLQIPFVPCTGRPVSAVPEIIRTHAATRYVVAANGALVYDVAQRRYMHAAPMDKKRVLALYEQVADARVTFDLFSADEVLSERARYEAMRGFGIDEPTLRMLERVRKPIDETVPRMLERVPLVVKVTCFWHTEQDRDRVAQAVERVGGFSCSPGHPQNLELQAEGVCKGMALEWLCAHAALDVSRTVAFGDEANDLSLIEAAGDGVAMANATEAVRAVAAHIAPANDEAGVAQYVESILVNETL